MILLTILFYTDVSNWRFDFCSCPVRSISLSKHCETLKFNIRVWSIVNTAICYFERFKFVPFMIYHCLPYLNHVTTSTQSSIYWLVRTAPQSWTSDAALEKRVMLLNNLKVIPFPKLILIRMSIILATISRNSTSSCLIALAHASCRSTSDVRAAFQPNKIKPSTAMDLPIVAIHLEKWCHRWYQPWIIDVKNDCSRTTRNKQCS